MSKTSNYICFFFFVLFLFVFLFCFCLFVVCFFFASQNFRGLVSKTWRLIFANFNFRGRQRPRKINFTLFREDHRGGGITRLSLDRSTVRKENLRPKYLKRKGIKNTCSLTDTKNKQTEHIYIQTVE